MVRVDLSKTFSKNINLKFVCCEQTPFVLYDDFDLAFVVCSLTL